MRAVCLICYNPVMIKGVEEQTYDSHTLASLSDCKPEGASGIARLASLQLRLARCKGSLHHEILVEVAHDVFGQWLFCKHWRNGHGTGRTVLPGDSATELTEPGHCQALLNFE